MTRYTKYGCVLAGVLLSFACAPVAASACSVPGIRTFDNQTSHGTMTVRSGRPCTIRFRSSTGPLHSVNVVQRPSNGTVRTGGHASVTYQSRSGFIGGDTFTYARQGQTPGGAPSTRTVTVAVAVRP
ncbi:MAG: hypothetical protein JWN71_2081 [Xanthobacteraceae bacterium]|nr:hypothetical protein [Xanthobacteraceae bacterium]